MTAARDGGPAASTGLSAHLMPADLERTIRDLGSEPRECPVCSGGSFERRFRRSGKWFWGCRSCRLVFVHDIYPEFLEDTDWLPERYSFDRRATAGPKKVRKYDAFLALLPRPERGARMLEVGCGQGLFLEHARALGWSVSGVEILAPVAEAARARGLEVHLGTLEEARLPDDCCDVLVMREVIEHVVDPVPLMREVRRVLAPGGVAALATGNAGSWAARLRGGRWAYYRFGGHLHIRFFSPPAARALARAAGFEHVRCHTSGFAFLENEESRGRWYRPLLKLAQAPVSPLAGALGAGHRLVMLFSGEAPAGGA